MWTAIKGFFMGGSLMTYVYIAAAAFVALLFWRNWELGRERDSALEKVGAQQVVIAQLKSNVDFAKLTVEKWKTAQELFQAVVVEQSKVTYLASEEGKKLHVAFSSIDAPALAASDSQRLERNRNLGWARLNCLLQSGAGNRGNCAAGPSAAGEDPGPAPAR